MSGTETKKSKKRKMKKGSLSANQQGLGQYVEGAAMAASGDCSAEDVAYDRVNMSGYTYK